MTPSDIKVIEQKLKELTRLVEERDQIQARITKIEAAVWALIPLLEDEAEQQVYTEKLAVARKPLGMTGAIKRALQDNTKRLFTPAEVRDALQEAEFPLSGYANALAVIYTTLHRLCDQQFVEKIDGKFRLKVKNGEERRGTK